MFGSIGMPELIVIFVIALLVFGPRKLPDLGRSLGKTLAEFRKASNELRSTLEEEIRVEDNKVHQPVPVPQPAPPAPYGGLAADPPTPATEFAAPAESIPLTSPVTPAESIPVTSPVTPAAR